MPGRRRQHMRPNAGEWQGCARGAPAVREGAACAILKAAALAGGAAPGGACTSALVMVSGRAASQAKLTKGGQRPW